jgi:ABC-2 type transport system permease protein
MNELRGQTISLYHQLAVEAKLFWRSRQTVYLTFLIPLMGMALFVYLNQEGVLERLFYFLVRGLGAGQDWQSETSPMTFWTIGLIAYCIIDVTFESPLPKLVRQRDAGILKRMGGTPLRRWVLLAAKTLNAASLALVQVALIFAMGLVSADVTVAGSWWSLGIILLLGAFTVAALGWALSGLVRSADGAIVAVHAVYIPVLLLCGAFIPLEAMPKTLQIVAKALPLTYFVAPLRSVLVDGTGLAANAGDLLILLAWMVGSWIVALKTFRWE